MGGVNSNQGTTKKKHDFTFFFISSGLSAIGKWQGKWQHIPVLHQT